MVTGADDFRPDRLFRPLVQIRLLRLHSSLSAQERPKPREGDCAEGREDHPNAEPSLIEAAQRESTRLTAAAGLDTPISRVSAAMEITTRTRCSMAFS
jgi:hypothetical protein